MLQVIWFDHGRFEVLFAAIVCGAAKHNILGFLGAG